MRTALRAGAAEAKSLSRAIQAEAQPSRVGTVSVSGMLSEQLARQLSLGAIGGAVVVGDPSRPPAAEVVVHVIAGEPSELDVAFVHRAEREDVSVVLVQLWPQDDWTPPFVLSPYVVECRAGEGFPIHEIAARIAEAAESAPALAARIPALRDPVRRSVLREAVLRAALLGARGGGRRGARPLLTLGQARMVSRLGTASSSPIARGPQAQAALVAGLLVSGFALRGAARAARNVLSAPVADVAIAAGGTWALGRALARLGELRSRET